MAERVKRTFAALAFALLSSACTDSEQQVQEPGAAPEPIADVVFSNGRIYTGMDPADSVAVRDGVYIYVGDAEGAQAHVGESTRPSKAPVRFSGASTSRGVRR